ncbi:MAG: TM0106 family RecB-like putative nuclease [Actinobacteria bacterium]|nr:TM0106 family RecB-like putative nuclease [Actinomycetota bacterium]
MRVDGGQVSYSPSDLTQAGQCQFGLLRRLDVLLGWVPDPDLATDALQQRLSHLGDEHERRLLDQLRDQLAAGPDQVVEVAADGSVEGRAAATVTALRSGVPLIYQGTFARGRFRGVADFLIRTDSPDGYRYLVADAKLARHAKVSAMLQVSAYADQLDQLGIPRSGVGQLLLGDARSITVNVDRVLAVYQRQRQLLEDLLDRHVANAEPVTWPAESVSACGHCEYCQLEIEQRRDVWLVAGIRKTQRTRLLQAGISTIDDLATATAPVPGIPARTLAGLQLQAQLQVASPPLARQTHDTGEAAQDSRPAVQVIDAQAIRMLPPSSPGDIFFDFEGDPMWHGEDPADAGLEYLFGLWEDPPLAADGDHFVPFWAHDRVQERQALRDFLDHVRERRRRWPDMHIYHYADYEKGALKKLAARYAEGEDEVDELLRNHVLVDLYTVVRNSIRVGRPSYSLKDLEPFYMEEKRSGDVVNAGDSLVEYAEYCAARDAGRMDEAGEKLQEIEKYNRYDCLSTLKLDRWLRGLADQPAAAAIHSLPRPGAAPGEEETETIADPTASSLFVYADRDDTGRTPAELQAVALVAAAVGYFAREAKPFWWAHFDRLIRPVDEWADTTDIMVIDSVRVIKDWGRTGRQRKDRRMLQVTGTLQPGSCLFQDAQAYAVYEDPPPGLPDAGAGTRGWSTVQLQLLDQDDHHQVVFQLEEPLGTEDQYAALPIALTPAPGPNDGLLRAAAEDVAKATLDRISQADSCDEPILPTPIGDLLARQPPTLIAGSILPEVQDGDFVTAITAAVRNLDRSYLAVQGPPGSGKTYTAARVITALVDQGWKIGVVAQSHEVVDNLLRKVIEAGTSAEHVGKKQNAPSATVPWQVLKHSPDFQDFLQSDEGRVLGGTAWDFSNPNRVPHGHLDLLVVDEAGQYSLAMTLVCSVAAQRLLLLGDPQQLPQVSQGSHPQPVNESALGWLSQGQHTLPAQYGYFLDRTYRMSPQLTAKVSAHSYDNRLRAQTSHVAGRSLVGPDAQPVPAGIRTVPVDHDGNSVESEAEAQQVLAVITEFLTHEWREDAHSGHRATAPNDVIVVAPYNAQVDLIRRTLRQAGIPGVRVGTVDKFQGQEAILSIVSMTASALEDVPRGMDFLLSPNRINVAVSRGQWGAVVIHAATLTQHLPTSPQSLEDLGGFLTLTQE